LAVKVVKFMTQSSLSGQEPTHLDLRNGLQESLRRRLAGPENGADDPVYDQLPTENYITGVLGPQDSEITPEQNDPLAVSGETEDGGVETAVNAALSNSYKPSAAGFTCIVEAGARNLVGSVSAARYHSLDSAAHKAHGPMPAQRVDGFKFGFHRVNADSGDFDVDLSKPKNVLSFPTGRYRVEWRVHPAKGGVDARVLTITVVNEDKVKGQSKAMDVQKHLFQVELRLRAKEGAPFLPRNLAVEEDERDETQRMNLLYRNDPAFATGHGCAAIWPAAQEGRVPWIRTEFLPIFELPMVQSTGLPGNVLHMKWLATATKSEVVTQLAKLCANYELWIHAEKAEAANLTPRFQALAGKNLALCEAAFARMKAGVETLTSDPAAWSAFQLMNRTIAVQFERPPPPRTANPDPTWWSFQLAFILECIPGLCSQTPEEDPVHVLWFPTGGGKTEAYLGLTAFTIGYRRIRWGLGLGASGVTTLMRYTLRLVTIQQFQRAAGTICALEAERRAGNRGLGDEEISIGLWVGESSTPNRLEEAFEQLKHPEAHGSSPLQLGRCPYCQTELDLTNSFHPSTDRKSLVINCPSLKCPFHDRLPVYVVDEEIYRRCPTLLVGTVDKFARLPWVEETRQLFGFVSSWCPEHGFSPTAKCEAGAARCQAVKVEGLPPPSLIIQDELHLISGPLGTMVGVYEGLLDFLCRRLGRPPVIIGSSATVRRAEDQCRSLYGRSVAIFPPRALSPTDTHFSRAIALTDQPGRLYLGILPGGFTVKTTLIRIYASLLLDREKLEPFRPRGTVRGDLLRDPFWTIVAYFNSLRELGGAQRIIEDDVPAQVHVYSKSPAPTPPVDKVELTSRLRGSEIPAILLRLESHLGSPTPPPDMVLATNMISVGVDVRRLSTMVVTGQPKATAEYIQATSRIGREHPGLVITVYNWARPRDRSHMEDFLDYHATLYRHVEANSVTPYTDPALRRGLHAVIVAAVRILEPGMSGNESARLFRKDLPVIERLRGFLVARLGDPRNPTDPTRLVAERFDEILDEWAELVRLHPHTLVYHGGPDSLLAPMEGDATQPTTGLPTLNSLREVEASTGLRFEE
jgi:hypothetical protein